MAGERFQSSWVGVPGRGVRQSLLSPLKVGSELVVLHKPPAASSCFSSPSPGLCLCPSPLTPRWSEAWLWFCNSSPAYFCFCRDSEGGDVSLSAQTKPLPWKWMFQPVMLKEEKMTCSWKKIRADWKLLSRNILTFHQTAIVLGAAWRY